MELTTPRHTVVHPGRPMTRGWLAERPVVTLADIPEIGEVVNVVTRYLEPSTATWTVVDCPWSRRGGSQGHLRVFRIEGRNDDGSLRDIIDVDVSIHWDHKNRCELAVTQ